MSGVFDPANETEREFNETAAELERANARIAELVGALRICPQYIVLAIRHARLEGLSADTIQLGERDLETIRTALANATPNTAEAGNGD